MHSSIVRGFIVVLSFSILSHIRRHDFQFLESGFDCWPFGSNACSINFGLILLPLSAIIYTQAHVLFFSFMNERLSLNVSYLHYLNRFSFNYLTGSIQQWLFVSNSAKHDFFHEQHRDLL